MDIFKQLECIDAYIEKRKSQERDDLLLSTGMGSSFGLGFSGWNTTSPWAMQKDSDFDGIPDALDRHVGPGAFERVPWLQNVPWAMERDSDFDGIPDALDNHSGPGAQE